MDIGCHLPNQGPLATGEALVRFCREAEQRNVASLWVSDHVIFPRTATGSYPGGRFPHPPDKPYLEPVTVLAAAAVCTTPRAPRRLGLHPRPPPPGGDGQDAHQHRRALQRPADLRRRRRLVEGGARDPGRALPRPRPPRRRDPARLQGPLDRGQPAPRRRVLPLPRSRLRAQAGAEAAPADLGGRRQPGRVPPRGHAGRRLARHVQGPGPAPRGPGPPARGRRRSTSAT